MKACPTLPASPRCVLATLVCAASMLLAAPLAAQSLPQLEYNGNTVCTHDEEGVPIRMQCDRDTRRCLVAPDRQADETPLRRTGACSGVYDRSYQTEMIAEGYKMEPALAEAPRGWARDERGRVFQVAFDLDRRVVLGVLWAPRFQVAEDTLEVLDRVLFETGFVTSFRSSKASRHTFRVLEGELAIDDLATHATLFDYELRHRSETPLVRITTFFGDPERYDLNLDLGWGARIGEVRSEHRGDDAHTDIDFLAFRGGWDIYLSPDLSDRLRIGAGVGWGAVFSEIEKDGDSHYIQPTAEIETEFVLDSNGLHNLDARVGWEGFSMLEGVDDAWRQRVETGVDYEWVFLAINDQPLALHVGQSVAWRDDIPGEPAFWDFVTETGLRFSLWAPAPDRR